VLVIVDLKPVAHLTIGAVGEPGQRVFYLQAAHEKHLITLIIEKQHALAVVYGLDDLLAELWSRFARPAPTGLPALEMGLRQPLEPLFRVGQMGLAYDEGADMVVLVVYRLGPEGEEKATGFRFWATKEQMRALRDRALSALEGGRPMCSLCGELIDPGGHLCPRRNGHGNSPRFDL